MGRDKFLAALQKIDSMGFKDVEKLNRKSSIFKQLSIQERIRNLQSAGRYRQLSKPPAMIRVITPWVQRSRMIIARRDVKLVVKYRDSP